MDSRDAEKRAFSFGHPPRRTATSTPMHPKNHTSCTLPLGKTEHQQLGALDELSILKRFVLLKFFLC
jgi:hypothetical protein